MQGSRIRNTSASAIFGKSTAPVILSAFLLSLSGCGTDDGNSNPSATDQSAVAVDSAGNVVETSEAALRRRTTTNTTTSAAKTGTTTTTAANTTTTTASTGTTSTTSTTGTTGTTGTTTTGSTGSTGSTSTASTGTTTTASAGAPQFGDSRATWFLDPSRTLSSLNTTAAIQYLAQGGPKINTLSEPGILDGSGGLWFGRAPDPAGSGKTVYRHQITASQPEWAGQPGAGTHRAEVLADDNGGTFSTQQGQTYWAAWGFNFGADMIGGSGGEVSILDFHGVPDDWGNSNVGWPSGLSSPSMYVNKQGRLWFVTRYDANPNTPTRDSGTGILYDSTSGSQVQVGTQTFPSVDMHGIESQWTLDSAATPNVWYSFVMQFRLSAYPGQAPFVKLWMRKGNGAWNMVVDKTQPNQWPQPNHPYNFQKFGVYQYDGNWGSSSSRTMHSRGFWIMKDEAGATPLNLQSMSALLN